jgi:hypothetical protein
MGTLSLADGLLQRLTRGWTIFEAKSNPQAHRDHAAHENVVGRQGLKRTARKRDRLGKVQVLGCE